MERLSRLCILTLAIILMILPSVSLAQVSLLEDIRLRTKISAEYTCISLDELCQRLSESKMIVRPHRDCRDLKMQCRLARRTKADVMRLLAQWLPGTWQKLPNETGYELVRTERAAKLKKEWWETFLRVRDDAYKAQADHLFEDMKFTPEQRPTEVISPNDGSVPPSNPNAFRAFYNALPDQLKRQILANHVNYVDYQKDNGGIFLLDPARSTVAQISESAREALSRYQENLPADTQVTFRYLGNGVHASFFTPEGKRLYTIASMNVVYLPLLREAIRINGDLVALTEAAGKDALPDWKTMAKWQKQTVWKNTLPTAEQQIFTNNPFQHPTRAAAIDELSSYPATEYLADYYSTTGRDEETPAQRTKPAKESEWNQFAAQFDSSWKKSSDIVLIRNNRWYRDDVLEVPHATAQSLLTLQKKRKPNLTEPVEMLADLCDYARPLSLWQAANGLRWLSRRELAETPDKWATMLAKPQSNNQPPFFMLSPLLIRVYETVLFCNSLSAEQRTALFERRLPLSTLTQPQRDAVVGLFPALQQGNAANISVMILGIDMIGDITPVPGIRRFYY